MVSGPGDGSQWWGVGGGGRGWDGDEDDTHGKIQPFRLMPPHEPPLPPGVAVVVRGDGGEVGG